MSGPCAGLAVLDFTRSLAGSLTSMFLADNGAEVTIVESPAGHPLRAEPGFLVWGRGKRSMRNDGSNNHRELLLTRALAADIVLEDFSPIESPAVDLDSLRRSNRRLITCSLPAFGAKALDAVLPPDDALVAARSGIMGAQPGFREGPVFVLPQLSSYGAALLTVQALGAALYAREREAIARQVRVPLWHGALAMQASHLLEVELGEQFQMHRRSASDGRPLYRLYQCQDGRWLHLGVLTPRFWPGVALATGHPEWLADPRYRTMPNLATTPERDAFTDMLAAILDSKPCAEWDRLFAEHDVPCAPAQTVEEFMSEPQLSAAEMLLELHDERLGRIRQMGLPLAFERTPGGVSGPAPVLGSGDVSSGWTSRATAAQLSAPEPAPSAWKRPDELPFAGVRILDLSSFIAGPLGPALLADLGADVIKIEAPEGDGLRSNRGFLAWNKGKRGLALDLKRDEAKQILYHLAENADVLVENMRPGVADRLGIAYETLRARNPRLIYCSVSAFGPTGPLRDKPGFDPLLQARSGIERAQGGFQNPPVFLLVPATDNTCALLNAAGIALALFERERSGEGQRIETSLLRAACLLQSDGLLDYDGRPPRPANDPLQYGPDPLYRLYRCADGWLFLAARTAAARRSCAQLLGIEIADELKPGRVGSVTSEDLSLSEELSTRFRVDLVGAWIDRLRPAGVPAVRVEENYAQAFADDPLLTEAGLIVTCHHPQYGRIRQPTALSTAFPSSQNASRPSRPAPLIGEHSREILAEAGYDPETIASLITRRVVTETYSSTVGPP